MGRGTAVSAGRKESLTSSQPTRALKLGGASRRPALAVRLAACSIEGLGPRGPAPSRYGAYQDILYGVQYQDVCGYDVYYEEVRSYGIPYHDVGRYDIPYQEIGRYGFGYDDVGRYGVQYEEVGRYGIGYDDVHGYGVYDQVDRYPSGLIGHP